MSDLTGTDDTLPKTHYFAVIFTSQRTSEDEAGYQAMAARMEQLASQQPGYLGIESTKNSDGLGITVSYWESLEAIRAWHANAEHQVAQQLGKTKWYDSFQLRVSRVERTSVFDRTEK